MKSWRRRPTVADAEKTMQGLARIAVDHPGCDGVISDAIALIERLLKPLTVERASQTELHKAIMTLREHQHLGTVAWYSDSSKVVGYHLDGNIEIAHEGTIEIAKKLEREKKEADRV
jgi:hypothetical protein